MPVVFQCLARDLGQTEFPSGVLWRVSDRLRLCACADCKAAIEGRSFLGCECPSCLAGHAATAAVWAKKTTVNVCECCGLAWLAHDRANVCPSCWSMDFCRVCWQRPGVVCDPCATHLATPYQSDQP
jgi:hypothetical protein